MKKASLINLSLMSLLLTAPAFAKSIAEREPNGSETIVNCGTGDAIAGASVVYGASKTLYLQIDSQDDQQAPTIYHTTANDKLLEQIRSGKQVSLVLESDDSFQFGGETSKAALLQLSASKKQSFDRNSLLAEGGGVISLFCNLKTGE